MKQYIFLFLWFVTCTATAQRLKFRELFPLLIGFSTDRQKNELKEYLAFDLDHPNANLRLALIYESNYKKTDPLTDYAFVLANAEQAKIRYLKSKQLVDEHETKRNEDYYAPLFKMYDPKGKPAIQFQPISSKINGGYDSAILFLSKIPPIYKAFTKSVNFYDQSVRIFAGITEEFNTIEDVYLLYDESLESRFTQLKNNYDSSLYYLNKYIELIHEYPIHGHLQTYTIRPVITYRLDGLLTNINFLSDKIELWNYSTWAKQVIKKVNGEVTDMRNKLMISNEKLDETLAKISTSPISDYPPRYKVDKPLIFNLNNLDRQSAVLSLLEFKTFKQELEIQNRSKSLDTLFSIHNAEVVSALLYTNRKADTLIKEFKSRLTAAKVNKHHAFVTRFFGGLPGLDKYAISQQQNINESYVQFGQELRNNLVAINLTDLNFTNKEGQLKSGRFAVPLTIQPVASASLDQGLLITRFNRKNPDGSAYLGGIFKPDKKKNLIASFLARINPDGRIGWFKEISLPIDSTKVGDAHTYLGPIALTQEGCALLVHSVHVVRGEATNTFIYFNEKGEERMKIKLTGRSYPRFLLYEERSNSFALAFKGTEEKEKYNALESIEMLGINLLGEINWKSEGIQLTGTLSDVMSLSDGYLLTGNYFLLNDQNGTEFRTKISSGECSPYLIKLSTRGKLVFSKPMGTPNSFYLHRIIKINDMSIQLLGHPQTMEAGLTSLFTPTEKVLHIMTNRLGQTISTNY